MSAVRSQWKFSSFPILYYGLCLTESGEMTEKRRLESMKTKGKYVFENRPTISETLIVVY